MVFIAILEHPGLYDIQEFDYHSNCVYGFLDPVSGHVSHVSAVLRRMEKSSGSEGG